MAWHHWSRVEYHKRFGQVGRVVLAVAVDEWLFDELAAFGTKLEDLEPERDEKDAPAEEGDSLPMIKWSLLLGFGVVGLSRLDATSAAAAG
jgi:hypothetical protein